MMWLLVHAFAGALCYRGHDKKDDEHYQGIENYYFWVFNCFFKKEEAGQCAYDESHNEEYRERHYTGHKGDVDDSHQKDEISYGQSPSHQREA